MPGIEQEAPRGRHKFRHVLHDQSISICMVNTVMVMTPSKLAKHDLLNAIICNATCDNIRLVEDVSVQHYQTYAIPAAAGSTCWSLY